MVIGVQYLDAILFPEEKHRWKIKIKKGNWFIFGIFDIYADTESALKTYIGSKPFSAYNSILCPLYIKYHFMVERHISFPRPKVEDRYMARDKWDFIYNGHTIFYL